MAERVVVATRGLILDVLAAAAAERAGIVVVRAGGDPAASLRVRDDAVLDPTAGAEMRAAMERERAAAPARAEVVVVRRIP